MGRFRIIAATLLLWNLAGLFAFVVQWRSDPHDLGDAITEEAFTLMPAWAWAAYAMSTVAGTLGSITLLARSRWAWVLFAISLAGVLLQFSWTIFGFGLVQYKGAASLIFPAIIALIALAGMLYARHSVHGDTL